jgi:hypothetical protein
MRASVGGQPRIDDYSVALIQSEAEALHTPNLDLSVARLGERGRPLALFTERDFMSLFETSSQYDCIIVGFNALYQSPALREAFDRRLPDTGLIVMHQLRTEALTCFKDDLALRVRNLADEVEHVQLAEDRNLLDEVVLNWPNGLIRGGGPDHLRMTGKVHSVVQPTLDSAWRPVLDVKEDETRYPALLRTKRSHPRRIIVCYLWVEPREPRHIHLLENMVNYCAVGVPEVAVFQSPGEESDVAEVARRLALQGRRSVVPIDRIDFASWPLRHCRQLVVQDGHSSSSSLSSQQAGLWMKGDAAIVVVGKEGDLTLHYRSPDEHWIALRWAAWFNAVAPQTWLGGTDQYGKSHRGSVFQTRAVLRMLMQREMTNPPQESEEGSLGLKPVSYYQPEVERFFSTTNRWKGGSLDETISTTAAALDIDRLLQGKAISVLRRRKLMDWLRHQFPKAGLEDKLDIARCLRDTSLFQDAQKNWMQPSALMPPSLATKLREAALVCGAPRGDLREAAPQFESSGLEKSLLLACGYLEAMVVFRERFPDHPLASNDAGIDAALHTIGRYGQLLNGDTKVETMNAESVGAEASALIAYFGPHPATTHVLAEEGLQIPVALVDEVFRETSSSRAKLAEAREELSRHRRQLRSLIIAQYIMGALVGVASGAVFFLAKRDYVWAAATFLGISAILGGLGLSAPWTAWVFKAILAGPQGLLSAIGERLFPSDEHS